MADALFSDRLDVTDIDCRDKHGVILARWNSLPPGQSFLLVNAHDPLPLYYQFTSQFKGEFDWVYEERGPKSYAIRITRLAEVAVESPLAQQNEAPSGDTAVSSGAFAGPTGIDVDARGLPPPEPMQRIMEALASLSPGTECRALTDRRPIHLVPMLEARGFRCVE